MFPALCAHGAPRSSGRPGRPSSRGHLGKAIGWGRGRPAGLTLALSPWQLLGSDWALGLSQALTTPSKGRLCFSWRVGSHLLRGVNFPDAPCLQPGGDWRQLWRRRSSKLSLPWEQGREQGWRAPLLRAFWPLLCLDLCGSDPWQVNSAVTFGGWAGPGQVCLIGLSSPLRKCPGLGCRSTSAPGPSVSWRGRWRPRYFCPLERASGTLASVCHVALGGWLQKELLLAMCPLRVSPSVKMKSLVFGGQSWFAFHT